LGRVATDMLAAHRACVFELAHYPETFHIAAPAAMLIFAG